MGYIDVDTHVHEPLRAWDYMNPNERCLRPIPIVTEDEEKRCLWLIGDQVLPRGSATRINNEGGGVPPEAKDLSDVSLRLKWMDQLNVDYQVIIPSVFLGTLIKRKEREVAMARSYNRWMAENWAESGGRLLWTIVPALADIDETCRQMEIGKKNGGCAVLLRAVEQDRPLQDHYFSPIYRKALDLDLAIAVHVGNTTPGLNALGGALLYNTVPVIAAMFNVITSDIPERFAGLRFAFLEASAAWIPFVLDRTGRRLSRSETPLDLSREFLEEKNVFLAAMADEDLPYIVSKMGQNSLVIGTDFGHTDLGTDIEALDRVARRDDISDETKHRILEKNGRTLYGLT